MDMTYTVVARDSNASNQRVTGLSPNFIQFRRLSDGAALTEPIVSELGEGVYKFTYDPELNGEASWIIDLDPSGLTLTELLDREIEGLCALEGSIIQSSVYERSLVQTNSVADGVNQTVMVAPGGSWERGTVAVVTKGTGRGSGFIVENANNTTGELTAVVPIVAALDATSFLVGIPSSPPSQVPDVDSAGAVSVQDDAIAAIVTALFQEPVQSHAGTSGSLAELLASLNTRIPAALINGRLVVDLRAVMGRTDIDGVTLDNLLAYTLASLVGADATSGVGTTRQYRSADGTVVRVESTDGRATVTLTPLS